MVKNQPSNARGMGLIPGQGTNVAHTVGELCLRVTTIEPVNKQIKGAVHMNISLAILKTGENTALIIFY